MIWLILGAALLVVVITFARPYVGARSIEELTSIATGDDGGLRCPRDSERPQ